MTRRAAKIDINQPEIVQALRASGCTVQILSAVGKGCPDILVGYRGCNFLIEIKNGPKAKLTADQVIWHDAWGGHCEIARSVEDALRVVGLIGDD